MKKRKVLRNVSLVALSAIMMSGVALAAVACGEGGDDPNGDDPNGGGTPTEISVSIFCSRADEHTNRTICNKWAAAYSTKIGREIKVNFSANYSKDTYLETLDRSWNGGLSSIADIIYLSPKYVQTYADAGYVMDLAEYLSADGAGDKVGGIWNNALSYYGYKYKDKNYTLGQQIEYREEKGGKPAGFYTVSGNESVGVYALPKDYSNFSMGYNKKFFTDKLRYEYQTRRGSDERNVTSGSKIAGTGNYTDKYTGDSTKNPKNFVATFAADGQYQVWNPETAEYETKTATKGEEAPIICIGVPVTYKPFNFYRYNDFESARTAGDPMACTVDAFSYRKEGYTVTIPGFPGDTFDIDKTTANTQDENAYYDSSMGHVVYTYAEYGALVWAVTYYLNTFAWQSDNPLSGNGGIVVDGAKGVIYGSEQYEGIQGNALYLLPWLASNDADLINSKSTQCFNTGRGVTSGQIADLTEPCTDAEPIKKLNLDGSDRTAQVQYGFNSDRFIETYAAFQEFGSTWNGNSGNAGDEATAKTGASGWDYFRAGQAVFYGAGTWDAAARNDTGIEVFEFGQMPSPVAEKYALYSRVNNADYTQGGKIYSNANNAKGKGDAAVENDAAQRSKPADGLKVYSSLNTDSKYLAAGDTNTYQELVRNQILRQDKWAARMDSVGYAANGRFARITDTNNSEYWKKEGCASLIQALTIGEEDQITLTYAGAQLPNYKEQCKDFLYYQDSAYADKSFAEMITPEGSATVGGHKTPAEKAEGRALWDKYYSVAVELAKASRVGSSDRSKTVSQWIASQTASDYGLDEIKYDPQYANIPLSEFTGDTGTNYGFAMKVLRMVAFTYADRDLNIRMQYGLNSVRDSSMYTANTDWLGYINAANGTTKMLAYTNQKTLDASVITNLNGSAVSRTMDDTTAGIWTPKVYCLNFALGAQQALNGNQS